MWWCTLFIWHFFADRPTSNRLARLQQIIDSFSSDSQEVQIEGCRVAECMQNTSLRPLSTAEYSSIQSAQNSPVDSAKRLLNIAVERCSDQNFYKCFLASLKTAGYEYVTEWLKHDGNKNNISRRHWPVSTSVLLFAHTGHALSPAHCANRILCTYNVVPAMVDQHYSYAANKRITVLLLVRRHSFDPDSTKK